tara:strand:+ start:822 stop:959 length:138 start_codon:yes stop_codon:yes gene_type:complete
LVVGRRFGRFYREKIRFEAGKALTEGDDRGTKKGPQEVPFKEEGR